MTEMEVDVEHLPNERSSGLPWVEKYRPNSLQDLVAHEDIVKILNQLIDSNKLPHLLFYGPPGTGATPFVHQHLSSHFISCKIH